MSAVRSPRACEWCGERFTPRPKGRLPRFCQRKCQVDALHQGETSVLMRAVIELHSMIVDEFDRDPLPHPADYCSPTIGDRLRELIPEDPS